MSSIINPANHWLTALGSLLSGNLSREYKTFHDSLNCVAKYVIHKSGPRLVSKRIKDSDARETMIERLYKHYCKGITTTELCASTFMRKIVKRDRENDCNLDFIYKFVVPPFVQQVPYHEKVQKDPGVRLWLREFCATTMEPQNISDQRGILATVPKNEVRRFIASKNDVNKELSEAIIKGWIDGMHMDLIMSVLAEKKKIAKTDVRFTRDTAVHYFIVKYSTIIESAGERAESFRASILKNLISIQNNLGLVRPSKILRHDAESCLEEKSRL